FDRYPYTGTNWIQAVAETLVDIEQDRAIRGVCPPNVRRNSPCHALVWVHLPPPYHEWKLTKCERLGGIPQASEVFNKIFCRRYLGLILHRGGKNFSVGRICSHTNAHRGVSSFDVRRVLVSTLTR